MRTLLEHLWFACWQTRWYELLARAAALTRALEEACNKPETVSVAPLRWRLVEALVAAGGPLSARKSERAADSSR